MMCYKDQSFCASDCTNSECGRHFGPSEEFAAKKWGATFGRGDNPPVAFVDLSGDCPNYTPEIET